MENGYYLKVELKVKVLHRLNFFNFFMQGASMDMH